MKIALIMLTKISHNIFQDMPCNLADHLSNKPFAKHIIYRTSRMKGNDHLDHKQ